MIGDFIQFILQLLGLKKDENKVKLEKYEQLKKDLQRQKTLKHDEIEDLKGDISSLDRSIVAKEQERNVSHGENRSIVEREIANLFFECDSKKGLQNALFQALEHSTTMISKVDELLSNLKSQKFDPVFIDLLTEDLLETLQIAKEKEKAIIDLRRHTTYTPQSNVQQYDQARVDSLRGAINATTHQKESINSPMPADNVPTPQKAESVSLPMPSDSIDV